MQSSKRCAEVQKSGKRRIEDWRSEIFVMRSVSLLLTICDWSELQSNLFHGFWCQKRRSSGCPRQLICFSVQKRIIDDKSWENWKDPESRSSILKSTPWPKKVGKVWNHTFWNLLWLRGLVHQKLPVSFSFFWLLYIFLISQTMLI